MRVTVYAMHCLFNNFYPNFTYKLYVGRTTISSNLGTSLCLSIITTMDLLALLDPTLEPSRRPGVKDIH